MPGGGERVLGACDGTGLHRPVLDLLGDLAVLAEASEAELAGLATCATLRELERGQVLLLEGERSDALYAVVSGRLKVLLSSERGDELVLSLVGPGEALGEISVLDGLARSVTVQATVETRVLVLPGAALRSLLERSPRLALSWAALLAGQVRRLTGSHADLVFLDLPHRLAKLLVEDGGTTVDLGASQAEVAARLGVARQSLNRALAALHARGWVDVDGRRIVLRDRAALARFARG